MDNGSFGSGRTSAPPAVDFPSYTFLEKVGFTPAEAYWLGLPIPNVDDSILDTRRALGGYTGSNSQFSRAATRSYSPSYGLIHSSYSNNHLMSVYPGSVLIRNPTAPPAPSLAPAVGRYYATNSTSPYAWSSTDYNNWSSSDSVGFDNAYPGYVHEAVTNYQNQYGLQPAHCSGFSNHQLQAAVPTLMGHGMQAANYSGFSDIPFVYNTQQPNGTRLADPLAALFEQDSRQQTSHILCNAFEEPTQGANCLPQAANTNQGPPYIVADASPPPFVSDQNGYLYEFKDVDNFHQEQLESQDDTSAFLFDASIGMDVYFESGHYLLDDIDGLVDPADPSDLFID